MILKKLQFLRGLIHGEAAYTGPFFISVDITHRCNMTCAGCQYHSSKIRKALHGKTDTDFISSDLIEKICTDLLYLDTHEVFLMGQGEPLLHPRIDRIITAFKKAGSLVQLFTNGALINREKALMLLSSDLDVLRVSLWATNTEEYKKCYPGVKTGNLQKVLDGIRTIHDLKIKYRSIHPKIILTTPLNCHNWRSIEKRVHLAKEIGCNGVAFDVYQHWGEFESIALSAEEISELGLQLQKIKKTAHSLSLEHNIDDVLLRYRLGETAWRHLPCYAGWFHTRILIDGKILPCSACTSPLGNLMEKNLNEIWNEPAYKSFRRQMIHSQGASRFNCFCDWCCLGKSNFRVHRIFRWVEPVINFLTLGRKKVSPYA